MFPKEESGAFDAEPDLTDAGILSADSTVESETGVEFTLLEDVNFTTSSSLDKMEVEGQAPTSGKVPTFRLTKEVMAKSEQEKKKHLLLVMLKSLIN